jgi:putative ABC transport system permease protein
MTWLSDLQHAIRMLRKERAFALTVLITLALGIGANTAIFTVVNTVILHPLPYPNSDRIVSLGRSGSDSSVSEPVFTFWQQHNPGFEDLAAYHAGARMTLSGGDRPELVDTAVASQNYFRLFGADPVFGRTFSSAEDRPGGARVVVLSYGLWQRRFGGNPAILGHSILLGGVSHTLIGILTPGFRPEPPAEAWIPLQPDPHSTNLASVLTVSARLPRGIGLAEANAWIAALGKRFLETHPPTFYNPSVRAAYLRDRMTGDARPALMILLGAVGLVLLIACANVANLLLARGTARHREISIRAAIGAGRGRLVRQLLTEGLLLALGGGILGLALGSWGVHELLTLLPGGLPRLHEMATVPALDPLVAGFTFALATVTGILTALAPAFHLSRTELTSALNGAGTRTGAGRKHSRTRAALVVAEMAIAVVLVCGAALLLRSFAALHSVSLGFDPTRLLTIEISLAGPGYARSSDVALTVRELVERAERVPGVQSAAVASALPLSGKMDMIFNIPGHPPPAGRNFTGDVQWRIVSPHYFDVLRIPVLSGRLFTERERRPAVIINQSFAHRYFSTANPVGQSLFIGPELGRPYQVGLAEIIGVIGDTRERLDIGAQPVMYQLASQIPDADIVLIDAYEPSAVLVRTRPGVAPMSVSQAVRRALQTSHLAAGKIRTIEQLRIDSTARRNFSLILLGLFAALALTLAAVGIYGVLSYSVGQRTREIGIRAALGANPRDTAWLVLRQALVLALAGIALGVAGSFGLTRLLAAQLFGVRAADPLTFSAVPLILLAFALAAAYFPARRAGRIDPLIALRQE